MDIVKFILSPILFAQEKRLRSKVVTLKPPQAPVAGIHGDGKLLRVLLLGDSTAKSVGVQSTHQTLIHHLIHNIEGFQVEWQVIAATGNDSEDALKAIKNVDNNYDVVMTALGVNDVTGNTPLKAWLQVQQKIRHYALEHLNAQSIIISGILPIWNFPKLPQPLKWYLSNRALVFDRALRKDLSNEPKAHYLDMEFSMDLHNLAQDGYHPGPKIYEEWARRSSAIINQHFKAPAVVLEKSSPLRPSVTTLSSPHPKN